MANSEHLRILKSGVHAFNEWREMNPSIRPNLTEAYLKELELHQINLHNADLRWTDLHEAKLSDANLSEADLSEADLSGAYLGRTSERVRRFLRGIQGANLHRAVLRRADLSGANLNSANLSEANLNKADLRGANLSGANLSRAKLNSANLCEANLSKADLSKANLSKADLKGANLSGADIWWSDLHETNFSGADLSSAKIQKENLKQANISGANLSRHNFRDMDLREMNLKGVKLMEADLSYANLSRSDISGANINGANIHKWKIDGIKCTHIIWKDKSYFFKSPGDFEKSFAEIESVVEILLDIPFSDTGYYTGRIIEQAFNRRYGGGSLLFKGQTAISDDITKYEFIIFAGVDEGIEIKDKLSGLSNHLNSTIIDAKSNSEHQSAFGFKSEIDIPFSGGFLVVRPQELERIMKKRYAQMHPLLQNIIQTIQLHIR